MIDFKAFEGGIRIAPNSQLSSDPLTGKVGQIYWNTTRSVLRICVAVVLLVPVWQDLFIHRSTTEDATLRWDTVNDRYTQNYDLLINSSNIYSASGLSGLNLSIKGGDSTNNLTDGAKITLIGGQPGTGGNQGIIEVDAPKIKQVTAAVGRDLDIESGDASVLGNSGGDLNLNAGLGIFNLIVGSPESSDVVFTGDSNGNLINTIVEWYTPGGDYYAWLDSTIPATAEITDIEITTTGLALQNTSFNISSADANDYYVWFNVDSLGFDPGGVGTGIEVQILSTDPDTTIAANIATQLGLTFSFSAVSNILPVRTTVTDLTTGPTTAASDVDTTFTISAFQSGANATSGTDPLIPAKTGIQVIYALNDSADNIASAFQAAIGSPLDYSSSVLTNTVTITNAVNGNVTDTASSLTVNITQGVGDVSSGVTGNWNGYGYNVSLAADNDIFISSMIGTVISASEDIVLIADRINIGAQHSVDPAAGFIGDIYYNTDSERFRKFDGTAWGWWDTTKNNISITEVEYKDDTLTVLPATTATIVDGGTIQDKDYVLFTALSSGSDRIYKASVSGINITWSQVPYGQDFAGNPLDGDIVYVKYGSTNNDYLYSYNGTVWAILVPRRGINQYNTLYWDGVQWQANDILNINNGTVFTKDNAIIDASPTDDLILRSGSKTAGTGDAGDISIQPGSSLGGEPGKTVLGGSRVNITQNASNPLWGDTSDVYYDTTDNKIKFYDSFGYRDVDGSDVSKNTTGFTDFTSTLSWVDGTKTLTISPVGPSFEYYIKGKRYVKTSPESLVLSDTQGPKYIAFDGPTLIEVSLSQFDLNSFAHVAYIYWDQINQKAILFGDERYSPSLSSDGKFYLNEFIGLRVADGFSASNTIINGNGSLDVHSQIAMQGGLIYNEDRPLSIYDSVGSNPFNQILSPAAEIPVMYKLGVGSLWTNDTPTTDPFKLAATVPQYNFYDSNTNTWTVVPVADGNFFTYWVVSTYDINDPIRSIMGRGNYSSLNQAKELSTYDNILFGNLHQGGVKVLYRVIFQYNTAFTNTPKVVIKSIDDLRFSVDKHMDTYTRLADHGKLSGLTDQDHPATAIFTNTSGFGGVVLTSSQTDVQLALDRLDDVSMKINMINVEKYAADPVVVGAAQIYYDTVNNIYKYYDGTIFKPIGGGDIVNGDRNCALLAGGTVKWKASTNTLSWNKIAYVQVPGVAENRNQVAAGNVVLPNDGDVAYIDINRTAGAASVRPVTVVHISALGTTSPTNENRFVIARRHDGDVYWGLQDGQRISSTEGGVLTEFTLINNTANALVFAENAADNDTMIVKYSLKRGLNVEVGHLYVTNDGTSAGLSGTSNELGDAGVVFSAVINGANIEVRYTTTSTGIDAEMRYVIEKWDAS